MAAQAPHQTSSRLLLLIGAFKLCKAGLLVLMGVGALRLLHRDVAEQLTDWITQIRVDPHSRYLHAAIARLGLLDDHKLRQISFGLFFYASLLTLEGVGLCLRKRWAEYFTIGMTTSLVPLEILELTHRVTAVRAGLLLVNLLIVAYLVRLLRRRQQGRRSLRSVAAGKLQATAATTVEAKNHSSSHTVR